MAICTPMLFAKPVVLKNGQLEWSPNKPGSWRRLLPGGKPATWEQFVRFVLADDREIILFVHGYDQSLTRVAERAAQLQAMVDEFTPGRYWVVPFGWPCRAWSWSKWLDYRDDKKNSIEGAKVLAQFLSNLAGTRLHVLAHSMGNRVWREAVALLDEPPVLGSLSLVAADIPFWDLHPLRASSQITTKQRTLVVTNTKDAALKWSGRLPVNGFVPRLGRSPNPPTNGDHVRVWRCDELASQAEPTGHSYFFGDNDASRMVFHGILQHIQGGNPCV